MLTPSPFSCRLTYITSRVQLANYKTSSKDKASDSKDRQKELMFEWDTKIGNAVAHSVPPNFGVRCGATVKGFVLQGSSKLNPLKWPTDQSKKSQVSLKDLMIANSFETVKGTLVLDLPVTYCTKIIKVDQTLWSSSNSRTCLHFCVEARSWKCR